MFLPKFEDPFLKEIARSLKKRLKRIEQQGYRLSCSRQQEQSVDGRIEKLELSAEADGVFLELYIWANREIWLHAFSENSVNWSWEHEGRLIGNCGARLLVQAYEASLTDALEIQAQATYEASFFNDNWLPLIAQGPEIVR